MTELALTIVEATPSLNTTTGRGHWTTYTKLKKRWDLLLLEALSREKKMGFRSPLCRARLQIERVGKKILDRDNLRGGVKPLVDNLRARGLIINDNEEWLDAEPPTQRLVQRNELPHTVVRITYLS